MLDNKIFICLMLVMNMMNANYINILIVNLSSVKW